MAPQAALGAECYVRGRLAGGVLPPAHTPARRMHASEREAFCPLHLHMPPLCVYVKHFSVWCVVACLCPPVCRAIIDSVPTLRSFKNCPWASGAHAQTFFSLIKFGKRPTPRRDVVVMGDGVQIVLDWFDAPDTPRDAPLVVTLHGIGTRAMAS